MKITIKKMVDNFKDDLKTKDNKELEEIFRMLFPNHKVSTKEEVKNEK